MPGFSKTINLNQTEHQVEAMYNMPFLLRCLLILHFTTGAKAYQTEQQDEGMYSMPFLLLSLFTLDKN